MTTIYDILARFRAEALSEQAKGARFERLMAAWLRTDARYADTLARVWLWEEFPARGELGGADTGIDLVARTRGGDYWAVQCKCYASGTPIDKPAVDSFLATSGRTFTDPATGASTGFAHRLWISTTNRWGHNAEEALRNQHPPVSRVHLHDLDQSSADWEKLLAGQEGAAARAEKKQLREHQRQALAAARAHYAASARGKLIMACGTGKTFTSLRLVEQELRGRGLVLLLVPSIALLGQTLNDWMADASAPMRAICICSDARASRKARLGASTEEDAPEDSIVDLALPASTSPASAARQLQAYRQHEGLVVVFSTYQSIGAVAAAQAAVLEASGGAYGTFDFIVCDEAHRTTGARLGAADESSFTKVHSDDFVRGRKRLYMTATPRLYGESAKVRASRKDYILCSMDDEALYGREFYRVNFSYAVQNGILTDYKVLILTVSDGAIPGELLKEVRDAEVTELNFDDTGRLVGVINGLSKKLLGDGGVTWAADPRPMRRAIAFTGRIGSAAEPGTSKNVAATFPRVSALYNASLPEAERARAVRVAARHIGGGMGATERFDALAWLAAGGEEAGECRVLTNVRCLSEGIDVPALDAVLFLSSRHSQVDVVQSVGRVMRSFRRGQPDEKKYGYIIIPVVVPEGVSPEEALEGSDAFAGVWNILNALRSHDDHFNAYVNSIALSKHKGTKVTVARPGLGQGAAGGEGPSGQGARGLTGEELARQLALRFDMTRQTIYAKLVEKCGDRLYWENWAGAVGEIARKYIARIAGLVGAEGSELAAEFEGFVRMLRRNLNPGITAEQCIEMLAQHLITRPVFEALFAENHILSNNSISVSMQRMVERLRAEAVDKDLAALGDFYESVRVNVGQVDSLEGKQTVIKNLYEKFFKRAFPLTVEKLGMVYTPVECVDFILHSVDDVLRAEFGSALTCPNVHVLDPFTGTGTFIARLLQSGLVRPEDMVRKYTSEIHANELILLAYYVADVNIESVFQAQCPRGEYLPFKGLCLTDTFQQGEEVPAPGTIQYSEYFRANSEAVEAQRGAPIRVIIGNPPYSVGQRAANDNAQNQRYPRLEQRIAETYARAGRAQNLNSLYDSYIKAFRWASDRIDAEAGGVVAFISNAGWLDGAAQAGMRACLAREFDKIYVLNLRGNARTSGELRRREADNVFGQGTRTPVAITLLVRHAAGQRRPAGAEIYYRDIGDYLNRDRKLKILREAVSYKHLDWARLKPNAKHDWINQRDGAYDQLLPLAPEKKFDGEAQSFFCTYSRGVVTAMDAQLYSFSKEALLQQGEALVEFYNAERKKLQKDEGYKLQIDSSKLSWTDKFRQYAASDRKLIYKGKSRCVESFYRPFIKQYLSAQWELLERGYQQPKLFPDERSINRIICLSSIGVTKPFSCLMVDRIPDLGLLSPTQCFPLYWYEREEEDTSGQQRVLEEPKAKYAHNGYIRRDGVTDWIFREARRRYPSARNLTKGDIFYYVYGALHSPAYRERFAADLRKSLPRIPLCESAEAFMATSEAGRALADLHLHYEGHAHEARGVRVNEQEYSGTDLYAYYAVEKMRFPSRGERDTIIVNGCITVEGIPAEAYGYVVNGKSAVEWVMERYAVTVDRKSGIKNDPNAWAREHEQPRYILDLLLSVIHVSVETMRIVGSLPEIVARKED